jgi:D-alanyl-lipoteichoic acid acyltransferase DltB (MBOAT superfamily)
LGEGVAFNTLVFPVFFAVVFVLFWATPWLAWRKALLLIFSYVFYSSFEPSHLLILIGLTLFNFALAFALAFALERSSGRTRRALLTFIVTVDIGALGFFKYIAFVLGNLNAALAPTGAGFAIPALLLPIGISFYTFEVVSYIVDIYRRKIPAERSLLDFALLLAFFPRLVAGPIVRPADFLPQLKVLQSPDLVPGLRLILIGLFQKLVIADYAMAPVVDWYFLVWTHTSSFDTWVAVIAFAVQIYCDFNGYTLCAIGLSLLLGFRLPINFNNPYAAIGLSDFWRRWHMSLSSWIRDYLYIPLGGSRYGLARTCFALLIAMTLAGIWHGASWNFALWGLIHGSVLCAEHLFRAGWRASVAGSPFADMVENSVLTRAIVWGGTLIVVCLAWVPFRAPSWEVAASMLSLMTFMKREPLQLVSPADATLVLATAVALLAAQVVDRWRTDRAELILPWYAQGVAYGFVVAALISMGGDLRSFIYFQF